jgi:serine/threonine protein kinase
LDPSEQIPRTQPPAPTIIEGLGSRPEAAAATIIESPSIGSEPSGPEVNLVTGGQFLAYRLARPLPVGSGEADLWLAQKDSQVVVIKLYRYQIRPKVEITNKLEEISRNCIVEVFERGVLSEGRHYEVQEYMPHGSLAELARCGLPEEKVRSVLVQLAEAVKALHALDIVHRDLKPSNILVRSIEPLELVLTDFGISSVIEVSLHKTSLSRTAAYSAPETLTGVVSKASDWWSIGIILLELLTGHRPFEGLNEQVVNFALASTGVPVPENLQSDWRMLIRGLLTRKIEHRWGEHQVQEWLSGRRKYTVALS